MRKKIGIWGIVLFLVMHFSMQMTTEAQGYEEDKRILFISSYSYAWESVQNQIHGIEQGMGDNVILDYEFMDTRRVYNDTSVKLFYEELKYRFECGEPYDIIILGDDAALLFAMKYRDELFADVPLLFLGVNDEQLALESAEDPLITGVVEKASMEKNIALAIKLDPDLKRVYAILDNSPTGQAERKNYYECADKFTQLEFKEINASELSTTELKTVISKVEEGSILLYIACTRGSDGNEYSEREAIKLFTDYSKVPVMRTVEPGIGDGLLGGYVVSMQEAGKIVAQMAMAIIGGTDPGTIDVLMDGTNIYMLDEAVINRYGLDVSSLPEDAVIINQELSYSERYGKVLGSVMVAAIVLFVVVLFFSYDNVKRRKIMKELEETQVILESASEHDFLTNLPNRNKFVKDFENIAEQEDSCTIFMMDINKFKFINDTHGHAAGDEALQQLAERLKMLHSPLFTAYRYAGDEFIVILKTNQSKIVYKAACQCREVFDKPFIIGGEKMKIGGSIGIACYPDDTANPDKLVICADNAMYHVKKSGKSGFAFYRDIAKE